LKKIILSILLVGSVSFAEPVGVEQEITQIDVEIKRLQDRKKFLEAQLIANNAEEVLESKEDNKSKEKIAAKEDEKIYLGFTTHTELGFISTSGNTDTETYNVDINLKKEWEKHIISLNFLMIYGEEDGVENKNKMFGELNYYYKFTDRLAFDYLTAYKEDKFSGFNNQFYTGPGLVYKAIDAEKHSLLVKGNILYSRDDIEDTYTLAGVTVDYPYPSGSLSNNDGSIEEYAAYKAQLVYEWDMLENLKFSEDFRYRSSFENKEDYFIYSKTALTSKISDIFSFSLSHQIDYINEAAAGKTSTDKTTMFNLIVDY